MMLETLEIPKDYETLHKFKEISLMEENPPLKSMEIENPYPDFHSFDGNLGGSVKSEALQFSEKIENPDFKSMESENPDFKNLEIENPFSDLPKSEETPIGCSEIQPFDFDKKPENTQITKTLIETSVLETQNSIVTLDKLGDDSKDRSEDLGEIQLRKTLENTQITKTLDEPMEKVDTSVLEFENSVPKERSEDLNDAQLSKTLDKSVQDDNLENPNGSNSDSVDNIRVERGPIPLIRGENRHDCDCLKCWSKRVLEEEEEEEYKFRLIRSQNYLKPPFYCRDCGCEKRLLRDILEREPPCPCGNCDCIGERLTWSEYIQRHEHSRFLRNLGYKSMYIDRDRFYGNRAGGLFMRRQPRKFEPEPEPEPCPVGAGLANLGNTCFLNSIMQCFTHTVVLVEGLFSLKHEASSHGVGEFCVLCAVRDQIEFSFVKSGRVIAPSNLVDNLSNISSFFRRYQQEDAHEFLQGLLDKLDQNWSKYEAIADDAVNLPSSSDTLVQRIFGGRLVSQVRCCKCGHSSDTPDPIIDLSLEIGEVDTLESALNSFTKVETLDDTEKIMCGNCKERVKAEKQLMIDRAPLVAALHLKRFKSDGYSVEKIDKMVDYPFELDLAPYTKGSSDVNEDLKYELFAFVVHVGLAPTHGHYFCYIRTSPNEWYRFDDYKVTRVSEGIALRQEAYILFYTKKGTPWFGTLFDKWKQECHEKISSASPKSVLNIMDLSSTSNPIDQTIKGQISTTPLSELRPQDEVKIDEEGLVNARDSLVSNSLLATSSSVPIRNDDVDENEAGLDDKRVVMEENGSNERQMCKTNDDDKRVVMEENGSIKGEMCKTNDEIGSESGERIGTFLNLEGFFDCDLDSDIGDEPSAPIKAQSPTKLFGRESTEGTYEISRNHLKPKHKSSTTKKSTSKQEMKRREAAKLCKSMPGRRGSLFMNLVGPQKKRKQGSIFHRQSPKKRLKVSPKRALSPVTA